MEKGNTKPLYNYLTKHSGRSNNISGLKDSSPEDIPNKFADHFSSVFSDNQLPIPVFDTHQYPQMEDVVVHKEGLRAMISNLDVRKAGGPDNITAIMLKYLL